MAKYAEIFDELRLEIINGKYAVGGTFPSERALMRRFGASRDSVRHAIRLLKTRRFVSCSQGRGTQVVFGRGRRIGLIPSMSNTEFFVPLAARISDICQRDGYALLFALAESTPLEDPIGYANKVKKIASDFVEQGIVGILYQPIAFFENAEAINTSILSIFDKARIPVVLLDYDLAPIPFRGGHDVVGIDHVAAGALVAEHLISRGARRIGFVMLPHCSAAVENRLRGVAQSCTMHGIRFGDGNVLRCNKDDCSAMVRYLSEKKSLPDAVICGYDSLALNLVEIMRELGISVPDDMMLAGFDDRQVARCLNLTSVHQPIEQIADAAMERIVRRIEKYSIMPSSIMFGSPLAVRSSTDSKRVAKNKKQDNHKGGINA